MPPKRPRRTSPSASGLNAGERLKRAKLAGNEYSLWGWVGTEVADLSEVSQEHRLATCGLSKHSPYPFCLNKYIPKKPKEAGSEPKVMGELEEDVIIISDDEGPECNPKLCKNNPNCLSHLGQEKWEDESKARVAYLKLAKIGSNPLLRSRKANTPVGLKNLGATCYANAFLQVWFQDIPFRNGVFRCQPSSPEDSDFEDSPIFQLQVTFAALQLGNQSAFNPVKLVESLKLRTTEQQDAQEFSKLFMAHLDHEFQKQSVPGLKSLLADQFQGKQIYGTQCSNCKNRSEREAEFLEIEVNLQNNASLEDRLGALLESEDLSGDNQYLCSVCDALQDANRYTEFKELPPVLHISLLRFVFDLSSMERKKSKHSISFPMSLDMDRFLGSEEARKSYVATSAVGGKNVYQLRGVLLHKGASAYHGHYEAQIFDVHTKSWYQLDDETVTKIDSLGPATRISESIVKGTENSAAKINGKPAARPKPKPKKVEQLEEDVVEVVELPNEAKDLFPSDKTHVSSKHAYMLIYARASNELDIPDLPDLSVQAAASDGTTDILNPNDPPTVASLPSRVLELINSMNAEHEKACEEYTLRKNKVIDEFHRKRDLVMDIYRTWCVSSHDEESVIVSRQSLEWWLSRYVVKQVKENTKSDEDSKEDYHMEVDGLESSDTIICEHGGLDPVKASNMKRILKTACERIRAEDNYSLEPALPPTEVCIICVENMFLERLYQIQHPQVAAEFDEVSRARDDEVGFWISRAWIKDWRLSKPKMHKPTGPDPPPDHKEYSEDVICEHGGLAPNVTARRRISTEGHIILKRLFPDWKTMTTDEEICAVCEAMNHISKEDKRELRRQAEEEKAKLKHTYEYALVRTTQLLENVPCAIVPAQFLRVWKQWLLHPTERSRPEALDNSEFICEHGLLTLDPNIEGDHGLSACIIKRSDWNVFEQLYKSGPLIAVENTGSIWTHEILVCQECRQAKRSAFDSTELTVRILKPSDSNSTPESHPSECVDKYPSQPTLLKTYGSQRLGGLRQSKRIQRQGKDPEKKRKFLITRAMTVKDLKITIQENLNIPTLSQQLLYRGKEVVDNEATLISLGILSDDIMDLREIAEDVDMLCSDDEDAAGRKSHSDEGRGFGGTLLSGYYNPKEQSDKRSPSTTPDDVPQPSTSSQACPACTFQNPPDSIACTICDTIFVSSI